MLIWSKSVSPLIDPNCTNLEQLRIQALISNLTKPGIWHQFPAQGIWQPIQFPLLLSSCCFHISLAFSIRQKVHWPFLSLAGKATQAEADLLPFLGIQDAETV